MQYVLSIGRCTIDLLFSANPAPPQGMKIDLKLVKRFKPFVLMMHQINHSLVSQVF